jgi:hypothetical protein
MAPPTQLLGSIHWQMNKFTFNNVPSGVRVIRSKRRNLIYQIDYTNSWMALWNSTDCRSTTSKPCSLRIWQLGQLKHTDEHSTHLHAKCYSWNVTIPAGLTVKTSFGAPILKVYNEERIVGIILQPNNGYDMGTTTRHHNPTNTNVATQSISTIFDKWWAAPAEWLEGSNTYTMSAHQTNVEDGVIGVWSKELTTHYGFSVETGNYLWATESNST